MAIDINYVNRQADRLSDSKSSLIKVKNNLNYNKELLNQVWSDKAVNKITKKFDNIIKDINAAMKDCDNIKINIKKAALQVREDELKQQGGE